MSAATESFWDFSLALYSRPGVAPALIGLQDRLGLDVNMLLFCCWAGMGDLALSRKELTAVEALAEPWQADVVRPLRALRRRLKGGFGNLPADRVEAYRKRLNELEIDGERIAQEAMEGQLPRRPAAGGDAAGRVSANLTAYLQLRRIAIGAAERADLQTVVSACCPQARPDAVNAAFA